MRPRYNIPGFAHVSLTAVAFILAFLCFMLLLSGCSQMPPPRLHVLASESTVTLPESGTGEGRVGRYAAPVVAVGPVTLPEYLDRSEIVWRKGNLHLVMEDGDRWAESLRAGIHRVLSVSLARRLGEAAVVLPAGDRDSEADLAVPVFIDAFERDDQGRVTLSVQWEVRRPRQTESAPTHLRRVYLQTLPSGASAATADTVTAQVQAMNAHLESLAADIAASLPANVSSPPPAFSSARRQGKGF